MDENGVRDRARRFVSEVSDTGMPDLDAYARYAKAQIRYEALPRGQSGFTVPKGSSFIIIVNSTEVIERQRFTICHELAHISLNLPTIHDEIPSWAYAKRHMNEIWCDIFASELLMPYSAFLKRIPNGEPCKKLIETLAEEFGASFPATCSRYASLVSFPCAYATMNAGIVRYAEANMPFRRRGLRIPIKGPIPLGSVAHRLREAGASSIETDQVDQDVWLENCDSGAELSELSRHYGNHDQTISILWCTEEDLPRGELDRFNRRIDEESGLSELTGEITWEKHGPRLKNR